MAESARLNVGSKELPAVETKAQPEFRVLYGLVVRVRTDDPLGDDSEQTGAQFG